MTNYYRHGDLTLHKIENTDGKEVAHNGSYVLAEGKTTGHKHVLTCEKPKDLIIRQDTQGRYYFELLSEGTITHEEHKTIKVAPGKYELKHEREYDWFSMASSRVQD